MIQKKKYGREMKLKVNPEQAMKTQRD